MRTTLFLISATVLACPAIAQPANDDCANAQPLPVNQPGQCPGLGLSGDNFDGTQSGLPSCVGTSTFFKDVWYSFNSDANTEITVDVVFFTIDEWGIEVLDGCSGTSLFCDSASNSQYVVSVAPGTDHLIRFFTNNSTGSGGLFTICLSGNNIVSACDGGDILTDQGFSLVNVCQDGTADVIGFGSSTTSSEAFIFALTDYGGRIETMFIDPLDFDTMAVGEYRVYGVSYNGTLVGADPGEDILMVTSTGTCVDISNDGARIFVDLCAVVEGPSGNTEWTVMNSTDRSFGIVAPIGLTNVRLTLVDAAGRAVTTSRAFFVRGVPTLVNFNAAPGAYRVLLQWATGQHVLPVVLR
ncbi:MAG: hypothetical protein IPG74_14070 [Flavobacteriales bacterium]|nr:hypothetical protein [Flavobacteriales bacterium]